MRGSRPIKENKDLGHPLTSAVVDRQRYLLGYSQRRDMSERRVRHKGMFGQDLFVGRDYHPGRCNRPPLGGTGLKALVAVALIATSAQGAEVRFIDQSANLPAKHVYEGGWEHFVGGGVAVFDCNGDRRPDIFAAGGTAPARLFVNQGTPAGDLKFLSAPLPPLTGVTGAYPLDIDNDSLPDLVVLRVGPNVILRGRGGCAFEDATQALGFEPGASWSTAFSATWEADATRPTLAIGNYVDRNDPDGPFQVCEANELHRPNGNSYGPPLALEPGFCALSMLFTDWNRSGRSDLRVSNDRQYYVRDGAEQMWRFTPEPRLLTDKDGWLDLSIWGMGIASRDLTGDGWPEVMLTSMGDQILQYSDQDKGFKNAHFDVGATAHRPYTGDDGRPSTGWHAEFADVDNNGLADLFIAKGNVDQMPGNAMKDPNNLLIQQSDGTFVEGGVSANVGSPARGRGAALADFNADGLLDLVVVNRRAPMEIYRNVTEDPGAWVMITPRQPDINRFALGAWVELQTQVGMQTQEVTVGGGHAGGQLGPLHFDLGEGETAKARVIWPDGAASGWHTLTSGQVVDMMRSDTDGAALVIPR